MIVDPSVLIAILLEEEGFERYLSSLESTPVPLLSASSYVELFVVAFRRVPPAGIAELLALLQELEIGIAPFDEAQAILAREAFRHYGKGRHPAALNFGDCFSYALAKHRNEPLLFKGEDFSQTDVRIATP